MLLDDAEIIQPDSNTATRLIPLLDLTCLDLNATEKQMITLCEQAKHAAAVCIYSPFIPLAKNELKNSTTKIATVANFPEGNHSLKQVLKEIDLAIELGANEIDIVFPYHDYLSGKKQSAIEFVKACKNACSHKLLLKIILETGALQKPTIIEEASRDIIKAGADFLKTSTGKIEIGATLSAAKIMLEQIKRATAEGIHVGFKASGGIRTLQQVAGYLYLADQIMGTDWITPQTFRFGMSRIPL
ncbi:MAG: deoxyribose-phosphate aldolase [Proteobacteria bacterium]|nr:deoxyribose-phosphate aldolase [Pseudomonadota bacterium]